MLGQGGLGDLARVIWQAQLRIIREDKEREKTLENTAREIKETPFNAAITAGLPLNDINEARKVSKVKWIAVEVLTDERNSTNSGSDDRDTTMLKYLR